MLDNLFYVFDPLRSATPQAMAETQPVTSEPARNWKETLDKILDVVKKIGIFVTFPLPLSSRGVLINVLKAPIRLFQSLGAALNDKNAVFGDVFKRTLKDHMLADWKGGISDYYQRIDQNAVKQDPVLRTTIETNFQRYNDIYVGRNYNPPLNTDPEMEASFNNLRLSIAQLGFKEGDYSNCFYSEKTGTCIRLNYDMEERTIVIGIMGLGNEEKATLNETDADALAWSSARGTAHNFIGGINANVTEAIELGKALKEACNGSSIKPVIAGHSHGGMLAQCAAVANGLEASVFNSEPMGAGVRRYIRSNVGNTAFAENAEKITAFSVKGEWLGGTRIFNILSVLAERILGIPVPRTVAGKAYSITPVHKTGAFDLHCNPHKALADLLRQQ